MLSGNLPPGGVALGDEAAGLAARHKAQIFEAVDRQMHHNGISRRHRSTINKCEPFAYAVSVGGQRMSGIGAELSSGHFLKPRMRPERRAKILWHSCLP